MIEREQVQLCATIKGRVQGVGFRAFVVENASALGVTGWARNRWDGSVEVLAESDRETLEKLLVALRRGPRISNVTKIDTEWGDATGEFRSFHVKSTF
jgi:acylphosphatase